MACTLVHQYHLLGTLWSTIKLLCRTHRRSALAAVEESPACSWSLSCAARRSSVRAKSSMLPRAAVRRCSSTVRPADALRTTQGGLTPREWRLGVNSAYAQGVPDSVGAQSLWPKGARCHGGHNGSMSNPHRV